jgi:transposase
MHIPWPLTEAHLCLEWSLVNGSSSPFLSRAACRNFSFIVHDGSNNAAVFCDFVIQNLSCGFLQRGDFLVLDNALINHFQKSTDLDAYLWNYHGIFLQFLPTHSPDLNRIELLWNILVQQLKHFPLSDDYEPHTHRIARVAEMLMNEFTHNHVDASIRHCGFEGNVNVYVNRKYIISSYKFLSQS